jgi:hypothetical protein
MARKRKAAIRTVKHRRLRKTTKEMHKRMEWMISCLVLMVRDLETEIKSIADSIRKLESNAHNMATHFARLEREYRVVVGFDTEIGHLYQIVGEMRPLNSDHARP